MTTGQIVYTACTLMWLGGCVFQILARQYAIGMLYLVVAGLFVTMVIKPA